jgi:hypothetical protein
VHLQYQDLSLRICGKSLAKAMGLLGVVIIRTLAIQHGRIADSIISLCHGHAHGLLVTHHEFGLRVSTLLVAFSQVITQQLLLISA